MKSVWVATMSTASFDFTAVDETEEGARDAMKRAWMAHRRSVPKEYRASMYRWTDLIDDVNIEEIPIGGGSRDGYVLVGGKK